MKKYQIRTYEIKPHQLRILEEVKKLPRKNLHYVTGQQSNKHPNLTLREMKKFIRRTMVKYIRELNLNYHQGMENELLKFYCVFETTKDFFHSQHQNSIVDENVEMGIHFHLFLSSPDNYPWVCFPQLFHNLFTELTSLRHKKRCLSELDYRKVEDLEMDFILYHTKQFMYRPSAEMVLKNL